MEVGRYPQCWILPTPRMILNIVWVSHQQAPLQVAVIAELMQTTQRITGQPNEESGLSLILLRDRDKYGPVSTAAESLWQELRTDEPPAATNRVRFGFCAVQQPASGAGIWNTCLSVTLITFGLPSARLKRSVRLLMTKANRGLSMTAKATY